MKTEHKIIREMLGKMPIPVAREILETQLPPDEFEAIFYSRDVMKESDLLAIGEKLNLSESMIKKIRKSGYNRLVAFYFPQNKNMVL